MAKAKSAPGCLTYVGKGNYIIGVPTSDLHDVTADEAQRLIESGLYKARPNCGHEAAPTEPSMPAESGEAKGDDE